MQIDMGVKRMRKAILTMLLCLILSGISANQLIRLEDGTERPLINFDNAATTPALQDVMDEVNSKLSMYGSIGRGFSQKSNYSTDLYNATRKKVLDFVGADEENYTCFYVNNTTDGLNKLASALVDKDTLVLATRMEHHANDLSWRERCKVIYAEVDDQGRVDYDEIEKMLKENKVDYATFDISHEDLEAFRTKFPALLDAD